MQVDRSALALCAAVFETDSSYGGIKYAKAMKSKPISRRLALTLVFD